jgi:hypothetical protein
MFKPNASFKLSKTSKRSLATIVDPHKRGETKRALIQAELVALIQPKIVKNRKEQSGD